MGETQSDYYIFKTAKLPRIEYLKAIP